MLTDGALALFPLSNVALFPRVQAPLHVFEPRYRQMTKAALGANRCIGMAVVLPEHVDEMTGDPPLYPIGCAGVIAQSQRLPDGRYNIVLVGTQRFRITNEPPRPPGRLYRVAEVEPLDDPYPAWERGRVAELRLRIVDLLSDLVRRSDPERARQISYEFFEGVDDVTFVNSLCNALSFPPEEKQGLLEAADIPARFDRLEGLLSFRIARLESPGAAGSNALH